MPRVANPPASKGRASTKSMSASPQKNSPIKIPLNDDRGEKAARLQSRQALHDIQMNQIKAAATPLRKLSSYSRASSSSPQTPRTASGSYRGKENEPEGGLNVVGSAVTPMKRVPILANFEEWMKMATDNKINAANSWNFALIDYFHDMSLLKEGDGVNFQKASCTLDGCVKIYTSRVDSVATETGKLLSGLADSGDNKKQRDRGEDGEEGEDDEEEEEGEDGVKRKVKRKQRSHEATLAPSFASLQLKKLELEFAVDPLFKKASADFDEGGAKGLLLNHLAIDSEGRIVFDSSDDAADATSPEASKPETEDETTEAQEEPAEAPKAAEDIDLGALASQFFPDLSLLDTQDVCPSLKTFSLGDGPGGLDLPFLKSSEDWRQDKTSSDSGLGDKSGIILDEDNAAGFDDDDDGILGGFDLPANTGFGEGGEAWAKDAALEPMLRVHRVENGEEIDPDAETQEDGAVGEFDPANPNDPYAISINHQRQNDEHENILSYFDNALRSHKTWAGPEHWRIRRIKDANSTTAQPVRQRKEKEPFEIDFLAPMDQALADMIYTPASSNSAISLPKAQWKTKGRNLLPDDKHFSSKSLLSLFLKPKARLGSRRNVRGASGKGAAQKAEEAALQNGDIDPAYWASQKTDPEDGEAATGGDYDANFFADDNGLPFAGGIPDDDDDDGILPFADAQEMLSPPPSAVADPSSQTPDSQAQNPNLLPGSFGSQLVTQGGRRLRPEYVNYARVAKKIDIRKLKDNIWEGMSASLMASMDDSDNRLPTPALSADGDVDMMDVDDLPEEKPQQDSETVLKFTDLMHGLRKVYPEQQMKDISTSYCFICLLHLANEKGLVLQGDEETLDALTPAAEGIIPSGGMEEIFVRKDLTVGKDYEGE